MKLTKFLLTLIFVTTLSICYVHQQIELVKHSYEVRSNQQKLNDLLDQTRILQYNVIALETPVNLEKRLEANDVNLIQPQRGQVVHIAGRNTREDELREKKSGVYSFFKSLTLGREAQAEPSR